MRTLTESCDACGPTVQAKVRVTILPSMLPIYLCGHCSTVRLGEKVDVPCDFVVEYESTYLEAGESDAKSKANLP